MRSLGLGLEKSHVYIIAFQILVLRFNVTSEVKIGRTRSEHRPGTAHRHGDLTTRDLSEPQLIHVS